MSKLKSEMKNFEDKLKAEAAKNGGKISGQPEFLKFVHRMLKYYDPGERFNVGTKTANTNVAATAPPTVGAVEAALKAYLNYTAYAGRKDGSEDEAVSSRSATDESTMAYTAMVNNAREQIESFVGIDKSNTSLLFGMNSSDAIGKVAIASKFTKDDIILVPRMEHTSNFLPWIEKSGATVKSIEQKMDDTLDIENLEMQLKRYKGKVKLVVFSGASNITGLKPPIAEIVKIAHKYGAQAFVDCAQYAPHFKMDMREWNADFACFSGHKVGAPSGPGVLAAPKKWMANHEPAIPGGGTISDLNVESDLMKVEPVWAPDEAKHQPGTWNTVGIIELGAVCSRMMKNWGTIVRTEQELLRYAIEKMKTVPGFKPLLEDYSLYDSEELTPVISFNMDRMSATELSRRLAEMGSQNRGGDNDPICNHDYIRNVRGLKGIVRVSFSYHNTKKDVDLIVKALNDINNSGS